MHPWLIAVRKQDHSTSALIHVISIIPLWVILQFCCFSYTFSRSYPVCLHDTHPVFLKPFLLVWDYSVFEVLTEPHYLELFTWATCCWVISFLCLYPPSVNPSIHAYYPFSAMSSQIRFSPVTLPSIIAWVTWLLGLSPFLYLPESYLVHSLSPLPHYTPLWSSSGLFLFLFWLPCPQRVYFSEVAWA